MKKMVNLNYLEVQPGGLKFSLTSALMSGIQMLSFQCK